MQNRTDLAVESYESTSTSSIDGVIVHQMGAVTTVDVVSDQGAARIGKPVGKYITLMVDDFVTDKDIFDGRLDDFARILKSIMPPAIESALVACLGNDRITADALGPLTSNYILSTRHMVMDDSISVFDNLFPVSTITTGVLGDTGIETAEIIRGVVAQTKPSVVLVVDALAASSTSRLGTTVQFSDTGIAPGSGVGNHRNELSHQTLGVPVISIGIPTVVSTSVISGNSSDNAFVTPREIDRITQQGAKLIGMGINICFQPSIDPRELYSLVG